MWDPFVAGVLPFSVALVPSFRTPVSRTWAFGHWASIGGGWREKGVARLQVPVLVVTQLLALLLPSPTASRQALSCFCGSSAFLSSCFGLRAPQSVGFLGHPSHKRNGSCGERRSPGVCLYGSLHKAQIPAWRPQRQCTPRPSRVVRPLVRAAAR